MHGEGALDTLTLHDATHGEGAAEAATADADDGAAERLDALALAFLDLDLDGDGVAHGDLGEVVALVGLLGLTDAGRHVALPEVQPKRVPRPGGPPRISPGP